MPSELPFVSGWTNLVGASLRFPTTTPPIIPGSSCSTSSRRCSLEFVPVSFIDVFTSATLLPVTTAAAARSGVAVPLGLFDAAEVGLLSTTD